MRKISLLTGVLIFTLLFSVSTLLAGSPMRPGQWQVVTKTEMAGMPMAMPDFSSTYCLTEEDMVPRDDDPDQNCKTVEYKVSGNKVTWRIVCDSTEGKTESRGEISYHGDTFQGSAQTTVDIPGQGKMTITNRMTGKRIGDCVK